MAEEDKLHDHMDAVNRYVQWAVNEIAAIKEIYSNAAGLDPVVVHGRLSALQARMDLLVPVTFNAKAHPWCEDFSE